MRRFSLSLCQLIVCLLPSALSAASAGSLIDELEQLVNQRQYQAAFALGSTNRDEHEGDAAFDFLFGLAALETGNANEAVFALERAVATTSERMLRQRARLELAALTSPPTIW